jgi:hypothetical protein
MKNTVIRSIINNTFLINYNSIHDYFQENNLVDNDLCAIDGGFTLSFCPADSKKLFEKNLKTQPDDWYYRTHEVKYTLNSLGYRTKEFGDIDWKESIVIFGCSNVFGIGVTDEHTIAYFLEQLSGRPVINMGVGGSSIQTVLHNSIILNDSKYLTPKAVVNMWTDLSRYQCYMSDNVIHMGIWSTENKKSQFHTITNRIHFNLMNIKMIRNLWKNKTIYYEGTVFGQENLINKLETEICCERLNSLEYEDEFARDMAHPSYMTNENIAKKIYEKIKPQLENS